MRILYISHTHPLKHEFLENAGGMQRVSYQLVEALKKRSDIELCAETIQAGYQGNVNLQTAEFLFRLLMTLKNKAEKFEADIILFSSMVTATLTPVLRKKLDLPLVTINHGRDVTLPSSIYQKYVPRIFGALDGVISVSRATRSQCIKRGMEPEKGVALPNGIDEEKFNFPAKEKARSNIEQRFDIPLSEKKMLLTIGRFVERKGHRWFIQNVLPLMDENIVYVTVGDGPELQKVKKAVRSSEMNDKVFILGRRSDEELKEAYAASDIFVMPNIPVEGDMEGFGIVMLEANLAGSPVVASNLEGIKDVIADGTNGYKVPARDEQAFAGKLKEILKDNVKHFGAKSRKYVLENYSWKHVALLYVEYLKEVANKYSSRI